MNFQTALRALLVLMLCATSAAAETCTTHTKFGSGWFSQKQGTCATAEDCQPGSGCGPETTIRTPRGRQPRTVNPAVNRAVTGLPAIVRPPLPPATTQQTNAVKGACECPKLPEVIKKAVAEALAAHPGQAADTTIIEAKLDSMELALTDINTKLDNVGSTQGQIAECLSGMATAQVGTNVQLAAVIEMLDEHNNQPLELTLTVQSTPNLPASYVDTSTIWAVQAETGLSHAVLVGNSDDPEWDRLYPEYVKAVHKFPAMQLVDVKSGQLKISPTPQLVLYYVEEGRQPEVISGDRNVGAKLRDFYSN